MLAPNAGACGVCRLAGPAAVHQQRAAQGCQRSLMPGWAVCLAQNAGAACGVRRLAAPGPPGGALAARSLSNASLVPGWVLRAAPGPLGGALAGGRQEDYNWVLQEYGMAARYRRATRAARAARAVLVVQEELVQLAGRRAARRAAHHPR